MDAPTPTQTLLTLSQAARTFRLPVRWLRDEASAGRVPCLKAGRSLLFERDAVERVLSERTTGPQLTHHAVELALVAELLRQGALPEAGWGDLACFVARNTLAAFEAAFARGDRLLIFRYGRLIYDQLISPERRDRELGGCEFLEIDVAGVVGHLLARLAEAGKGGTP